MKPKTYTIIVTEDEMLLLSASSCIATVVSGTPEMFDALKDGSEYKPIVAKALLVMMEKITLWNMLVTRLCEMV